MINEGKNTESGFTFVELIVVLMLIGILAVGFSMGFVDIIQRYLFAQEATQTSQKAQLAMARIKIELTDATAVSSADADSITYTRPVSPPSCQTAGGCQFRIRRDGTSRSILLASFDTSGNVSAEQVLINRVATGGTFLSYTNFNGGVWTVGTGFNSLAQIIVNFNLTFGRNDTLPFSTRINPRGGSMANVPRLN